MDTRASCSSPFSVLCTDMWASPGAAFDTVPLTATSPTPKVELVRGSGGIPGGGLSTRLPRPCSRSSLSHSEECEKNPSVGPFR